MVPPRQKKLMFAFFTGIYSVFVYLGTFFVPFLAVS